MFYLHFDADLFFASICTKRSLDKFFDFNNIKRRHIAYYSNNNNLFSHEANLI